jgi:hypothetical protein
VREDSLTHPLELCNRDDFCCLRRHQVFSSFSLVFFLFHFRVEKKNIKNEINKNMSAASDEAKNFLDRLLGDVSKKSATKQILIGAGSGW